MTTKHSISPYPPDIRIRNISGGAYVFRGQKLLGEIAHTNNWGNDWRILGVPQWFASKTDAVLHLLTTTPGKDSIEKGTI